MKTISIVAGSAPAASGPGVSAAAQFGALLLKGFECGAALNEAIVAFSAIRDCEWAQAMSAVIKQSSPSVALLPMKKRPTRVGGWNF